jgi:hypothetical protein
MSRIIQADKIYAGAWPPLPEESAAEEYFTRILAPLDKGAPLEKGGDHLRLSIQGFEFGKTSQELCRLWYELQDLTYCKALTKRRLHEQHADN